MYTPCWSLLTQDAGNAVQVSLPCMLAVKKRIYTSDMHSKYIPCRPCLAQDLGNPVQSPQDAAHNELYSSYMPCGFHVVPNTYLAVLCLRRILAMRFMVLRLVLRVSCRRSSSMRD